MKKLFIGNCEIHFLNTAKQLGPYQFIYSFSEDDSIESIIDFAFECKSTLKIAVICYDAEAVFGSTLKKYTVVEAAGGIVQNTKGELLVIKRMGKWDLPKGKVEKGESLAETALREVEEECGIPSGLQLVDAKPIVTYHMYVFSDGTKTIKPTYWFLMSCVYDDLLKPQVEEQIEAVQWVDKTFVQQEFLPNTYATLIELVTTNYLELPV